VKRDAVRSGVTYDAGDVIGAVNGLEHVASVRILMAPLGGAARAIAAE